MTNQPEFRKWKSINKFSDVYAKAQKFGVKSITYRPKIKLHGTNAGIHIADDTLFPQKRSSFIDVYNDNCGFAKAVSEYEVVWYFNDYIIYGEWAGPGVQKGDAVCNIPNKEFFVFAIHNCFSDKTYTDPNKIDAVLIDIFGLNYPTKGITTIWWEDGPTTLDFTNQNACQNFIDKTMNTIDNVIAKEDPYIKRTFDISGPGEGYVFYPSEITMHDGTVITDNDIVLDYIFKVKTEAHAVQNSKKRNHVAPEKPEGIEDFIEMFFTENRFKQMLNQIGGSAEREKTGQFMKAVMSDVYKESEQEILLAEFEWKDVPKYAAPRVKQWWFKECDKL